MNTCVGIDASGYVVELAETFPECSEFALVTAAYLDKVTFWADLSAALDPSGPAFWPILGALLLAHATIAGARMVVSYLWLANQRV